MTLALAVASFIADYRWLTDTQDRAKGRCVDVSRDLWTYLRSKGFKAKLLEARELIMPYNIGYVHPEWVEWLDDSNRRYMSHTVVQVGRMIVDLTARQFDSRLPFPLIESVPVFSARWRRRRESPWAQ